MWLTQDPYLRLHLAASEGFHDVSRRTPQVRAVGGVVVSKDAFTFNGVDGYIEIPDEYSTEMDLEAGTRCFGLSLWFRSDTSVANGLVSKLSSPGDGWNVTLRGDISGQVRIALQAAGPNTNAFQTTTTALNDGQWHHCVYTMNVRHSSATNFETTDLSFWIDGQPDTVALVLNQHDDTDRDYSNSTSFKIGATESSGTPGNFFAGQMKDIMFFRRTLTQFDVNRLRNNLNMPYYPLGYPKTLRAAVPVSGFQPAWAAQATTIAGVAAGA